AGSAGRPGGGCSAARSPRRPWWRPSGRPRTGRRRTRCTPTSCAPATPAGRTFRRRRVTATQDGTPILCLEASFTTDRSAATHHVSAPAAPDPESCQELIRTLPGALQPDQAVELRSIPSRPGAPPRFPDDLWFRPVGKHADERVSASAVLTYISDLTFISAILRLGRRRDVSHMTSLDHVMWFHNEVRLDDWLLYVKSPLAAGDMRGLAQGSIFHRDGTLIATVAQEGLMHVSR